MPLKAPQVTDKQQRDIRYMNRVAPSAKAHTPPAAFLSMSQLYEIERLAYRTMNLATIGHRLHIEPELWEEIIKHNPDVKKVYIEGFTRMQEDVLGAAVKGAVAGDSSMIKMFADRGQLGHHLLPKNNPALVITNAGPTLTIDVIKSVDEAFERQRMLLEDDSGGQED